MIKLDNRIMGKQCNAQTKGKQSETVSLLFQDLLWIGGLHKSDNDNIMVATDMKLGTQGECMMPIRNCLLRFVKLGIVVYGLKNIK